VVVCCLLNTVSGNDWRELRRTGSVVLPAGRMNRGEETEGGAFTAVDRGWNVIGEHRRGAGGGEDELGAFEVNSGSVLCVCKKGRLV